MDDSPLALNDAQIAELDSLLQAVPAPLDALDTTALDGFLCGVLLQPRVVEAERWLPFVTDADGRPLPRGMDAQRLHELVRRRHAELEAALAQRAWFDPWIYEVDDATLSASQLMQPWVAGFSLATDHFPELLGLHHPALLEPLAVLYACFDADDLEDAEELMPIIETLEPPADLPQAVEDVVRSVLLLADVSRPRAAARTAPRPPSRRPVGPGLRRR